MAENKSILEEALLDIKNIQSALNANTKEILRSVAKEEIDSVVKESLVKEIYEEEDLEAPEELDLDTMSDEEGTEDDSIEGGLGDMEDSEEVAPEMEPELGMDVDTLGGEEMDMTAASDDDVIAIYKKLSGEDEIEIVGDEIHLNISEPGEYVVKLDGKTPEAGAEDLDLDTAEMGGEDEEGSEDDVEYEIEMDDEEEGSDIPDDLVPVGDEEGEEEEAEEEEEVEELDEKLVIGLAQNGKSYSDLTKTGGAGKIKTESIAAKKLVSETTKKYNSLLTEATKLKAENDEFRTALREFRSKLVETVVFNSNLTYVTRLLTEHSTTKAEKQNIIKRFDGEVSNLVESKKLYKTISNELDSRKPINESVERKIIKEASTSTSKQLNESTAYVDPSTKRIIDLMNRVEKR